MLKIKPNFASNFKLAIEAYVFPALTTLLKNEDMSKNCAEWMRKLQLVDLRYNFKAAIDWVLGAEVFEGIAKPRTKKSLMPRRGI